MFLYMYLWTKYTVTPRARKVHISSVYNISWWITDVFTSHKMTFSFSQLNCSEEMSVSQINEHPLWVNHCFYCEDSYDVHDMSCSHGIFTKENTQQPNHIITLTSLSYDYAQRYGFSVISPFLRDHNIRILYRTDKNFRVTQKGNR